MANTYTTLNNSTLIANENGTHFYMVDANGTKTRIKKSEYEQIIREDKATREAEAEARRNAEAHLQQRLDNGESVKYNGDIIAVYDADLLDWDKHHTAVDTIEGHTIYRVSGCNEHIAVRNAEPTSEPVEAHESEQSTEEAPEAAPASKAEEKPKKKSSRAKKNAAYMATINGEEITLTEKQVDFFHHLPDTCYWENGVDSVIWVDCLCDDIGGQFANKPMTVGAMISTICEKGLGVRTKDRMNGRKATAFALTELGKEVAKELGLN